MVITVRELKRAVQALLEQARIENAAWEAGVLTAFCLSQEVNRLPLLYDRPAEESAVRRALEMARRRAEHYPLQYLLGEWDFYGRRFAVGEGVLIPRQDTELLCEVSLELLKDKPGAKVLDLCSGSGCVAVTLKKERPDLRVAALEKSQKALCYLRQNAEQNGAELEILEADALAPPGELTGIDLIACNPPYLTRTDMDALQKEVSFEPSMALYGEEDGLFFYRELTRIYRPRLNDGGALCYEIGMGQQDAVAEWMLEQGFTDICFHRDLCGIIRTICGTAGGR